jgi:hypothetical protein
VVKPQLTLVENTGSWRGRAVAQTHEASTHHTVQSLPLVDQLDLFDLPALPNLQVFVVAMDTVHGRTLQKALLANKPRSVIDLRYVARFDQYGSDRDTFFAYLKSVGSYYVLESMPWHDLSVRDFMSEGGVHVPRVHHELIERDKGTVMLFVPKPGHANMLVTYLNRTLSAKAKTSWRIEQIG